MGRLRVSARVDQAARGRMRRAAITACAVVLKVLVSPAVEQRLQRSWSVPLWLRFLVCQHGRRTASYDSEKLRPFSEARQLGEIANAEYSYHAPTHAQLEELQLFIREILEKNIVKN